MRPLINNGIIGNIGSSLAVVPIENMTVKILNGIVFHDGYEGQICGDGEEIAIDNSNGALSRIDRIVMRNSVTNRNFIPIYIKGIASNSPVAPAPIRDGDSYDYVLCTITIPRGTTEITAEMITDERMNANVCGMTYSVGQAVDIAIKLCVVNKSAAKKP